VVSVTSDHGEALGEHGERTHGFFVYDATLRIPWLVRAPELAPATYAHQVRIVDVMPTLLGLAGAGDEAAGLRLDGVDLTAAVAGTRSERLEAYSETWLPRHQFGWSELASLRTEAVKFIEAPRPELYELANDPSESRNSADERRDAVSAARRTLAAIASVEVRGGRKTTTDPSLADRFMSLGYIGFSPAGAGSGAALADPKDKIELYELTMKSLEQSEGGDKAGALASLGQVLAVDPGIAQAHFIRGSILGDLGRFQEAAAALERTTALNPRYVTARFKLALAYLRLKRHADAERALEGVLRDEPENVRAWHNLAAVAYARGDLKRAEELELKALGIDKSYAEAWNTLGAIHIVSKRPAQALEALKTAAALAPANGQVQANLALAHQALGQEAAAAAARERACALDRRYCAF
jgi:tetratricopeptide (TPR) repeat protein